MPTPATNLFLAVGPFDLSPCILDLQSSLAPRASNAVRQTVKYPTITHFSKNGTLKSLQATMRFFPFIYKFIEEVLGTSFPLPSIQNVFIPDFEGLSRCWHSCCIYSVDSLLPEKPIASQTLETQLQVGWLEPLCASLLHRFYSF